MAAANLLIGTNATALAATITASDTDIAYPVANVQTGDKFSRWRAADVGTEHYIQYQFTTAQIVDYAFIGRADITSSDRNIAWVYKIQYSDNGSDWSDWHESASLTTATAGASSASGEDYIAVETASAAHVYWRLLITFDDDAIAEISHFYLGQALDLLRDPTEIITKRYKESAQQRRALYNLEMSYTAIPYAKTMQLISEVVAVRDWHPIVVFTASAHGILYNKHCLLADVVSVETPQTVIAQNDAVIALREVL